MNAVLDGRIFSRQTERIPAHRMQHVESAQPLVARHCVANRVVAHVAHVQSAGRIGKHFEHVVLLARGVAIHGVKRALLVPNLLPFGFDLLGIVFGQGHFPRVLSFENQITFFSHFDASLPRPFLCSLCFPFVRACFSFFLLGFMPSAVPVAFTRARRASTARPHFDGHRPAYQSASRG